MGEDPGNVIGARRRFGRARIASPDVERHHHRSRREAEVLNRYDLALARRVLAAGLLLGALAFVITAATDEAGSSTIDRLGRVAAFLPILGSLAASVVLAQTRSRGEMRALHALGVSPARAARGAWLGAAVVGLAGPALVALQPASVASLFPRIDLPSAWTFVDGLWVDGRTMLAVDARGDVHLGSATSLPRAEPPSFAPATVLTLALTSLIAPAWALATTHAVRRLVVALGVGCGAVTLFHLVAAERLPPLALTAIPLLLLVDLGLRGTDGPVGA